MTAIELTDGEWWDIIESLRRRSVRIAQVVADREELELECDSRLTTALKHDIRRLNQLADKIENNY